MPYSLQLIWSNNAQTTIANSISNTATSVNLASGAGVLFPSPGANQGFTGTLTDAATGLLHEIVLVTGRSGDTCTIVRGQEGTTPISWSANDLFGNLWTSGAAASLVQSYQLQQQSGNYAVDTGSVNSYIVGLTPAVGTAPPPGFPLRVKILNTNTGASVINAGWGSVSIVRKDGTALIGGELVAAHIADMMWDGTAIQLLGIAPATNAAVTAGIDTNSAVTPAQLASTSFAPSGSMTATGALTAPAGWLLCFGQAISRVTFANLFAAITRSATVAISIGSPAVVTWATHGLVTGDVISFESTGALPTGINSATNYFAIRIDANTFQIATTAANALAGTGLATSGSQSGTQTCRQNPFGCGDGSTTFNVPDARGRGLAGWDGMGGTLANRLGNNSSVGGFSTASLGNVAGEQAHTQTVPELVSHTHVYEGTTSNPAGGGGGVPSPNAPQPTGATGGGNPFNVTQPTLLVNVIIKT